MKVKNVKGNVCRVRFYRMLTVVLALLLLFSSLPITSLASTNQVYTITFNSNGGYGTVHGNINYLTTSAGGFCSLPGKYPSRDGYTCRGWSRSSTATTATYVKGQDVTFTANTTLYAVWKPNTTTLTQYIVTFNANGGNISSTTKTVKSGSAVGTLPTPTRSGYTLI